MKTLIKTKYFILSCWICFLSISFAQSNNPQEKRWKIEPEIDLYYSSIGLYSSLTKKPIPNLGKKSELAIYKELLQKIYLPRDLIIEVSINPLPYSATLIKQRALNFYKSAKINNNLNLIHSVTAGFEEPWALSVFLGNVVAFEPGSTLFYKQRKNYLGKKHGYSGLLINGGNFHIKDDLLIADNWIESEIKLKGEEFQEKNTLKWSFRFGSKFHDNTEISDVVYLGIKRDSTDYNHSTFNFLQNSGIEYTLDLSQKNLDAIRHFFLVTLKIPLANYRIAGRVGLGFVWDSSKKYSGLLAAQSNDNIHALQIIIRPKIEF